MDDAKMDSWKMSKYVLDRQGTWWECLDQEAEGQAWIFSTSKFVLEITY